MSKAEANPPHDEPTVHIRSAEACDLEEFRRLRLRALRDHPEAFESDYETHFGRGTEVWKDCLVLDASDALFVGEDTRGRLVGMAGVHLGGSPKSRHRALIWGVYVAPEWRRPGLAVQLLNRACDWARAAGATMAHLGVATVNEPAIQLYKRLGFQICAAEPMRLRVSGVYYDEHLMVKRFD